MGSKRLRSCQWIIEKTLISRRSAEKAFAYGVRIFELGLLLHSEPGNPYEGLPESCEPVTPYGRGGNQ